MVDRTLSDLSRDNGEGRAASADAADSSEPGAEARINDELEYLRASGARRTILRSALITALVRLGRHSTASELTEKVAGLGFVPERSAVLRTLGDLSDQGVVCTVRAGRTARRFGLVRPAHHHAACPRCDVIRSIPAEVLDESLPAVARAAEIDPGTAELLIIGVCAGCGGADGERRPAP